MKSIIIISILIYPLLLLSQKMPSDYFDKASSFFEEEKYDKTINEFQFIVDNHKNNELYPLAYYNVGYTYYVKEDYENAIEVFKSILESDFNETEKLGGGIMSDPFTNYRHKSSKLLSEIYYNKGNYELALQYLSLSDTTYPYLHFCGNEYAANDVYTTLHYAKIYQKLGNNKKAINILLPAVFNSLANNSKIIEELENLLSGKNRLIEKLDDSLKNIYSKTSYYNDGDSYERYYFKFLDIEIPVPLSFEYYDQEFDKDRTLNDIKDSEFYKMIEKL